MSPCPQCTELVLRSGENMVRFGCSRYPECDYVRPLKSQADGHIVKILEATMRPEVWPYWCCVRRFGIPTDAVIRNVNMLCGAIDKTG